MEVLIRQARQEDSGSIAAIYLPYVRDTSITFEETPPSPNEMDARISETLERFPFLVAERNNQVIGYAYAGPHRARASYRWSVDVAIYLAASHHRRGIGHFLYQRLLRALENQGFAMAYAGITLPNPASVRLHESFAFTPVAIYPGVGFKQGAWRDVGWWQCRLAASEYSTPAEPIPWPQMPAFVASTHSVLRGAIKHPHDDDSMSRD